MVIKQGDRVQIRGGSWSGYYGIVQYVNSFAQARVRLEHSGGYHMFYIGDLEKA